MRIFGIEITRSKAVSGYVPAASNRGWMTLVRESFPGAWQRNVEVRANDVLAHPTAFRSISLIKSDIAKMRVRLMLRDRRTGVAQETTNPAYSPVLKRPNRHQNRIQFFSNWVESKLIHGNAYILKSRDMRRVVTSLHVLDPLRTMPYVSPNGEVFYSVAADHLAGLEESVMIPASEIIHDRWNTFYHPLVGLSPISACGLAAVQGLRIQTNSALFFGNDSTPGGILTAPGHISDETAERLKSQWEQKFSGGNIGRIAVLGDGLSYAPMAMSAHDSQLIDQLRWTAETVAGCFGVPPYKLGIGQPPNFSNVAALNDQYYTQALQIHIESIELCLDEGLDLAGDHHTQFDLDALLRMDPMAKVEAAEKAVGAGIWSPDEARAKFDMPPVPGGGTPYLQEQNWPLRLLAERALPERAPTEPAPMEPPGLDGPPQGDEERWTHAQLVRALEDAARDYERAAA